jgi:hypothetical protein
MKTVLACTILLTGCSAYRITAVDDHAVHAMKVVSRVEITKKTRDVDFQCFEPMLAVLTVGIIPVHCVDTYGVSVTSATGETAQGVYRVSFWGGWVSLLLAPLPSWHLGSGHQDPALAIEGRIRRESQ